jgi:RND family efflux transporter MFP subunit
MSTKQKFKKIVLPVLVFLFGIGVMYFLIVIRPEPEKEPAKDLGSLVNIIVVQKGDREVIISATGTVQAAQEVSIVPQVSGVITSVSPSMVAGGFLEEGELLLEIEETDYLLAVEQAKAAQAKAEYDLATTESQARIARTEWERLNKDNTSEPNPLVLYEPQLRNARASLASAEASVEQAKMNLKRTKIRAPFNCRVRSEKVDIGQYVNSGMSVAVVAGTDTAEITMPLPSDELGWIRIPQSSSQGKGSSATVHQNRGGKDYIWHGHIIRSLGEVDARSRMMQVIVAVEDPYRRVKKGSDRAVLHSGAFVEIRIKGKKLTEIFAVPRTAVRDNATVWIMDEEKRLSIRPVTIVRHERDTVLVSEGLEEGERIVITSLAGAVDGMKLRMETGEGAE